MRTLNHLVSVGVSLALCCTFAGASYAQQVLSETPEQTKQRHLRELQACQQHLQELRPQIDAYEEGGDPAGFYLLISDYLRTAQYMVYRAKANVILDAEMIGPELDSTNLDLTSLVSFGYLPEWPANPLNNWQPMQVLTAGGSFSAGDLVFDLCPSSEATPFGDTTYRGSFQLYVYGMDLDTDYVGADVGANDWSYPPRGAFVGSGLHCESIKEAEERKARIEKWLKEHPADAPKSEEPKSD